MVAVDYGEQGPEHFDRFGIKQIFKIHDRRPRTLVPTSPVAAVQRLGLKLYAWHHNRHHNSHRYEFDVHGRHLEVRHYSDGRVKLFLDGLGVYTENVKLVRNNGGTHREIEKGPEIEVQRVFERVRREQELSNIKAMLAQRLSGTAVVGDDHS